MAEVRSTGKRVIPSRQLRIYNSSIRKCVYKIGQAATAAAAAAAAQRRKMGGEYVMITMRVKMRCEEEEEEELESRAAIGFRERKTCLLMSVYFVSGICVMSKKDQIRGKKDRRKN